MPSAAKATDADVSDTAALATDTQSLTGQATLAGSGSTDSGAIAYGEQVLGPQKHATGLTALGPDLFGEEVNTFTGGLSFSQTDLSLPGNDGLPVQVSRRMVVDGNKSPNFGTDHNINLWRGYPFGEWELDLPYLGGTYTENEGWVVNTSDPTARCSSPTSYTQYRPRDVLIGGYVNFSSYTFWDGLQLNVPGGGEQQVLYRPADGTLPVPAGTWTALTTKSQWHFACLPSLKSGQPGEGFLALAPDGTRYWFDWMVSYANRPMHGSGKQIMQNGQTFTVYADVNRRDFRLYPSRVEDRFGNYVTYTYASTPSQGLKVTQISASDGRSITLAYNTSGQISSATAGTQSVHYNYADGLLSMVILPDGTSWGYSTAAVVDLDRFVLLSDANPFDDAFSCQRMRRLTGDQADLVMTHPSGAQGVFRLAYNRLYRTNLKDALVQCGFFNNPDGKHPSWRDQQPDIPLRYDVLALQSKTLSGPGVAAQTWQYLHQDSYQLRSPDGDPINGTRTMTTVRPDGSTEVSVFGTDALVNEGQLLSQEVRHAAGAVLSRRDNTYVQASEMGSVAFPDWMGEPLAYSYIRGPEYYNRPLKQSVLQQQGVSFSWQVPATCFGTNTPCFDNLMRPLRTIRSSTLGYSKTEATTYLDFTSKWVLGQVQKVTCMTSTPVNTGCDNGADSVESETTFDPTYAVPLTTKSFGKDQKTLAYDLSSAIASGQRGTLKTVKDGNGNVTTVTNWKRGVPQTITYPATPDQPTPVQESAVVNDNGWITSVTDENGYTTGYGYDAMGRLTTITYPTGDSTAWNSTTIAYQKTG
ncbi:MAG: RHS repeat domain-containing protein, partial [Lysobacteraceae bacterium]